MTREEDGAEPKPQGTGAPGRLTLQEMRAEIDRRARESGKVSVDAVRERIRTGMARVRGTGIPAGRS